MISLNFAQYLADNGFGVVALTGNETGNLIFWEKLPLNKNGIFVMSSPSQLSFGQRKTQAIDIYSRGKNDIAGSQQLADILKFLTEDGGRRITCELPTVTGYSENKYKDIIIEPDTSIYNVGVSETDRVIYQIALTITYTEK